MNEKACLQKSGALRHALLVTSKFSQIPGTEHSKMKIFHLSNKEVKVKNVCFLGTQIKTGTITKQFNLAHKAA